MTTWQILTHFWGHHDLLFTKFGSYHVWVRWNERHFSSIARIRDWFGRNGQTLWAWCNIHG